MCEVRSRYRVLLIGASGQFGSKLARLLVQESAIELVLAGRGEHRLNQLQQQLPGAEVLVIDRQALDADTLINVGIDLVADLSGPYHEIHTSVVDAAIAAGVHYIDIADSRDYVNAITQFDSRATDAGVAIIGGASSTPALSHAVIDVLTSGWTRIDSIEATITPSNSQYYGLSVIQGILSRIGKPFSQFTGGAWRSASFWGETVTRQIPGVGRRHTSIVETPDNDLFVSRYKPVLSATFRASLELGVMHIGVLILSWLVRLGLMDSAIWLARPLQWLANHLSFLSNQYGGMLVSVTGKDESAQAIQAQWSLSAKGDSGPHVPILAALICIRKLACGKLSFQGASACTGFVSLEEFNQEFSKLGIETQKQFKQLPVPPFEIALEKNYAILPAVTRSIHDTSPSQVLKGEVVIEGARNPIARAVAILFRMPKSNPGAKLTSTIELDETGIESWSRYFPGRRMRSRMGNPDAQAQTVDECFGLFCFTLKLEAHVSGIDMHLDSGRFMSIRLPKACLPTIKATERADNDKHLFDVNLALPLVGRLVHYSGWLTPVHTT